MTQPLIRLIVTGGTLLMGRLEDQRLHPVFDLEDILLAAATLERLQSWQADPENPAIIQHVEQVCASVCGETLPPLPSRLNPARLETIRHWILGTAEHPGLLRQTALREWHRTESDEHLAAKAYSRQLIAMDHYAIALGLGLAPDPLLLPQWGAPARLRSEVAAALAQLKQRLAAEHGLLPEVRYPFGHLIDSLNLTGGCLPTQADQMRRLIATVRESLQAGEIPCILGGTDTLEWYASAVALTLEPEGLWQQGRALFLSAMLPFGQHPEHVARLFTGALRMAPALAPGPWVLCPEDRMAERLCRLDARQPFAKVSADSAVMRVFRTAEPPEAATFLPYPGQMDAKPWHAVFPPISGETPVRQWIGFLQALAYHTRQSARPWRRMLLAGLPREAGDATWRAIIERAIRQLAASGCEVWLFNPLLPGEPLDGPLYPVCGPALEDWAAGLTGPGLRWLGRHSIASAYWQACWNPLETAQPRPALAATGLPVAWEKLVLHAVPLPDVMLESCRWLLKDIGLRQLICLTPPSGVLPEMLAGQLEAVLADLPGQPLCLTSYSVDRRITSDSARREQVDWSEGGYAPIERWRKLPWVTASGNRSLHELLT